MLITLPNLLTVIRILLVPVFILFLLYRHLGAALGVLIGAGATDVLDGLIARRANQRTVLGTYLDPIADKILIASGFVTLSFLGLVPLWAAVTVVSRDLILMLGALVLIITDTGVDVRPTVLGKATTLLQLLYVIAVLVAARIDRSPHQLAPLLILGMIVTILSGLQYLFRGLRAIHVQTSG